MSQVRNRNVNSARVTTKHRVRAFVCASLLSLSALAETSYPIDLPSQNLADALRTVGRLTSTNVVFEPALVRGLMSAAIRAELTPDEAIQRLIQAAGLVAQRVSTDTIVLKRERGTERPAGDARGAAAGLDDIALEEIVVTATRRDTRVEDVPYNIQVLSSQTLAGIGARSFSDYARMIPGLTFTDEGARGGFRPFLRGLRSGNDYGLVPTTSTYVDDVQVDRVSNFRPLDLRLLDVERIEVLRGPQGTLYGGGSIGGTIRYISKKPNTEAFEGRVGTLGSFTRNGGFNSEVSGMLNVPLVSDKVALRLSAGHYDNDGFIDNVRTGRHDINGDEVTAARVALRVLATDNLTIDLTHTYQRADFGDFGYYFDYLGDFNTDYYVSGMQRTTDNLSSLSAAWNLGAATLTWTSSYFHTDVRSNQDSTASVRDRFYGRVAGFVGATVPEFNVITDVENDTGAWTHELRLVSNGNGPWDWIVGAYAFDSSYDNSAQERVPVPFAGQAAFESDVLGVTLADDKEWWAGIHESFRQYAGFGEIGYRPLPAWRVSAGFRYFDYRRSQTTYIIDQWTPAGRDAAGHAVTVPTAADASFGGGSDSGTALRFNTSYDLSDSAMVYLTIAEGYRPGGFNTQSSADPLPPERRAFGSDSIVSYEAGAKISWLDRRLYLSSSAYFIDWQDMQTQIQLPNLFGLRGNAGKAHSNGIELELSGRELLVPGFSFSLGYAWTNVELDERMNGIGMKGERAPFVPRHTASLMLDYERPLGSQWHGGVMLLTTYTGDSYTDFGPIKPDLFGDYDNTAYMRMASYSLTQLSFRLRNDNWSIRAFVDNLFDKDADLYLDRGYSFTDYRPATYLMRTTTRPRTIGLELTRSF